ncbi:MAG TPA: cell envelope integrity protein TolA, partial [Myxococcota bacterium]|nr:cell envelope integrity protein TolA [Myxococcota bacterium]
EADQQTAAAAATTAAGVIQKAVAAAQTDNESEVKADVVQAAEAIKALSEAVGTVVGKAAADDMKKAAEALPK